MYSYFPECLYPFIWLDKLEDKNAAKDYSIHESPKM